MVCCPCNLLCNLKTLLGICIVFYLFDQQESRYQLFPGIERSRIETVVIEYMHRHAMLRDEIKELCIKIEFAKHIYALYILNRNRPFTVITFKVECVIFPTNPSTFKYVIVP